MIKKILKSDSKQPISKLELKKKSNNYNQLINQLSRLDNIKNNFEICEKTIRLKMLDFKNKKDSTSTPTPDCDSMNNNISNSNNLDDLIIINNNQNEKKKYQKLRTCSEYFNFLVNKNNYENNKEEENNQKIIMNNVNNDIFPSENYFFGNNTIFNLNMEKFNLNSYLNSNNRRSDDLINDERNSFWNFSY